MPFAITRPESYVLAQVFPYQAANDLFTNDSQSEQAFDTEHTFSDGTHSTATVPDVAALFEIQDTGLGGPPTLKTGTPASWSEGLHSTTPYTFNADGDFTIQFSFSFTNQDYNIQATATGLPPVVGGPGPQPPGEYDHPRIIGWDWVSTNKDRIRLYVYDDAGALANPWYITLTAQGT